MLRVAARVITGTTYLALGLDVVRDVGGRPRSPLTCWPPSAESCRCLPMTRSSSAQTEPFRPAPAHCRCRYPASALRPRTRRIAGADDACGPPLLTFEDQAQQIQFIKNHAMLVKDGS
jgi:hypothetical protein